MAVLGEDAVTNAHDLLLNMNLGTMLAIIGTVGVVIGIFRKIAPVTRRLNHLMDDWFGEEERPGVKARKGVMQRMSDQDGAIEEIRAMVNPLLDARAVGSHQQVLDRIEMLDNCSQRTTRRIAHLEYLLLRHMRESRQWVAINTAQAAQVGYAIPPWPNEDESAPTPFEEEAEVQQHE